MARIFSSGIETGGVYQFTALSGASAVSTSGLSMDAIYCLDLSGQTASATAVFPAKSEVYTAMLYRPILASTGLNILSLTSGGVVIGTIKRKSTGHLEAYAGATLLATSAFPIDLAATYLVECRYAVANSNGRVVLKINGIIAIDFTGDTQPSTETTVDAAVLGYLSGVGDGYAYYDNIIVDDAGWIGKTYIQGRAVTGAGNSTQWTPSAGNNWDCVEERPASDADYVSSNTVGHLDLYAAGNMSGSIGSVRAVHILARAVKEGAPTPQNLQLSVRSGGTDYFSADKAVPTAYGMLSNIWELNPDGATAWLEATVNATEIGVKAVA